ncbi:hypothetical protein ACFE04_018269 [Oxalis oulophora]
MVSKWVMGLVQCGVKMDNGKLTWIVMRISVVDEMVLNARYSGYGSLETKLSLSAGVSCHEKVSMGFSKPYDSVDDCGYGSLETKLSISAGVSCHEKVFMGSFTDWFMTFLLDSGVFYGNEIGLALKDMNLLNAVSSGYLDVVRFVTVTAICNTVIPPVQSKTGPIVYKAQSQDEEALVYAAAWLHLVFSNKNGNNIEVRFNSSETQYEVLDTLEFTFDTKRMSVVVRDCQNGNIILLTKGADKTIIPLAHIGQQTRIVAEAVDQYEQLGLHTLCLAWRELKEDEYMEWSVTFKEASSTLVDKEWRTAEVCQKLENDLTILGVTAIEDRLEVSVVIVEAFDPTFRGQSGYCQSDSTLIQLECYSSLLGPGNLAYLSNCQNPGVGSGGTKVDNDTNFGS